ncbi:MAG: hypothetical protein ACK4JY_04295 [Brevundimonas sp.]|uniref:hypothetical protein n=1 Tax=Brevundimonas sp. TaxID=1871086 RepID=UPI00391D3FF9
MRLTIAAIALAAAASIAAGANAQQTPPPAPPPAPLPPPVFVPGPPMFVMPMKVRASGMDQFHNEFAERQRAAAKDERERPERRARAERLAALANTGHCSQAVRIARREGDLDMATRLVEACSSGSN